MPIPPSPAPRIVVFGAGSIGCYVGGRLLATGSEVRFVGRRRIGDELAGHGLRLTDHQGVNAQVPVQTSRYSTSVLAVDLAELDAVLVTVKSAATRDAGRELAGKLPAHVPVISLQNGIDNASVLRQELPGHIVLSGMVPFNVLARGAGVFHQASAGRIHVERNDALGDLPMAFAKAGLPLMLSPDMPAVQWAKLLLNLNNPVNALSDLPLREELSQRSYRHCLALAQREALWAMQAAGIRPARLTPLPARWLPGVLGLPDAVFSRLAGRMLAIDPLARSSMWEDLQAGRRTEIDWINGKVVELARSQGRAAPVNAGLVELVRAAESGGRRVWGGEELLAELRLAAGRRYKDL